MATCVNDDAVKRAMDLAGAAVAIVFFAPVIIAVACLVKITLGEPPFFYQRRPGKKGKIFRLIKIRTMRSAYDAANNLLPDAERLTAFGRFLRSTSLDELPEFFNVLKGDLSIVGPRPLLPQYLGRYTPKQARRHEVKPGLTGWAQIHGRNAISWEEKFELDVWYVDNRSLRLDVKIIAVTIAQVFKREGISAKDEATMPEFNPGMAHLDSRNGSSCHHR